MRTVDRMLMAVVATCVGTLALALACFPLAWLGVLQTDRDGIRVPAWLLVAGAAVIWVGSFAWLTATGWEN